MCRRGGGYLFLVHWSGRLEDEHTLFSASENFRKFCGLVPDLFSAMQSSI